MFMVRDEDGYRDRNRLRERENNISGGWVARRVVNNFYWCPCINGILNKKKLISFQFKRWCLKEEVTSQRKEVIGSKW